MREIFPNVYTFPINLPNSPLREIHSYILKGKGRSLVIDTGYNLASCLEEMNKGLDELGIEMSQVDLVITHLHADHSGLATVFYEAGARIFAGQIDGDLFNSMAEGPYWEELASYAKLYGIPQSEMSIQDNPGYRFKLSKPIPFQVLEIGSFFDFEDFHFEIVDLIGHTPGHIGLYDRSKGIMFSGDTVLDPITPNITFWGWSYPNILKTYMQTLESLKQENIIYLFPGHRRLIDNHRERIDQLVNHHFERLDEILEKIEPGESLTVRDITTRLQWRIKARSWDDFPPGQKWFASGETMAHLDYLVRDQKLSMSEVEGVLYFKK